MLSRVARFVFIDAVACSACSGQSSAPTPPSAGDENAVVVADPSEAAPAASASAGQAPAAGAAQATDSARGDTAATSQPNGAVCPANTTEVLGKPGSPLWLQSYGMAEISSLAGDATGHVLLARAGTETLKLDSQGALVWSKPFGSLVAADHDGNAYIAGTLTGSLALGGSELHSRGGRDAFVIKLAPDGAVVYGVALGGTEDDEALSLAVDSAGRVVVSGAGLGTVELDTSGKVLWSKSFFGELAVDSRGNAWLTGALAGAQDFGAGMLTSRGGADIFVVELGPSGEPIFSKSFGDSGQLQQGEGIAVDRDDNVVVTGVFDGSVDFGTRATALTPGSCPADAWCKTSGFALKLDAGGNPLWSVSLGPMRALPGVATDSRGNVALSGALPGGVTPFRQSWISELDSSGKERWRRAEWPDTGLGAGHQVAVDACDAPLWSISARPTLEADEQWYVAKLAP